MREFTHHDAHTVEEAVRILMEYQGKAKLHAGGTDLLGVLKDEILPDYPKAIVNVKTIPGLDHIRDEAGVLTIGALTCLSHIVRSEVINSKCPVLSQAARSVASPQIRNTGTMGGNLCQDVRCWYYRYSQRIGGPVACARKGNGPCLAVKGDNRYHAIMSAKRCFAVCPSDTAVALAALDGRLIVAGPKGDRSVAVTEFYNPLGNALTAGEMVRAVEIPAMAGSSQQTFLKFTLRKPIDFAIVSVAAVITTKKGVCIEAKIALGGIAPGPIRALAAEELLRGGKITEQIVAKAAEAALAPARPLSKNAYKVEIAKTLIGRAIMVEGT